VAEQKLDVKNLDLMLAVAELTFLRQFSFRGASSLFYGWRSNGRNHERFVDH
jgi:hypothetical protein